VFMIPTILVYIIRMEKTRGETPGQNPV